MSGKKPKWDVRNLCWGLLEENLEQVPQDLCNCAGHPKTATDTALALGGEHENGAIRTQENSGLLFKRILNLQHSSYKEHGKMFHLALDSQR